MIKTFIEDEEELNRVTYEEWAKTIEESDKRQALYDEFFKQVYGKPSMALSSVERTSAAVDAAHFEAVRLLEEHLKKEATMIKPSQRLKHDGLAKLIEECGELAQVAGKLLQYPECGNVNQTLHPDGTDLRERLQEEIGDVLAALDYGMRELQLDPDAIRNRRDAKSVRFREWKRNDEEQVAMNEHARSIKSQHD